MENNCAIWRLQKATFWSFSLSDIYRKKYNIYTHSYNNQSLDRISKSTNQQGYRIGDKLVNSIYHNWNFLSCKESFWACILHYRAASLIHTPCGPHNLQLSNLRLLLAVALVDPRAMCAYSKLWPEGDFMLISSPIKRTTTHTNDCSRNSVSAI